MDVNGFAIGCSKTKTETHLWFKTLLRDLAHFTHSDKTKATLNV